ncbi:FadR/GntR family transcriptional regulator [Dyella acidiphila]|uniref:FadR family transcriptional regulator n=1 Tax=Dyella acidiphila TaxID=2775866 RepID=A0ABR9GDU9_9GAMM|nr:FadR/GntR family transcriptional regulator [Dyella acidiphila]MBE1162225.1 FadR family transcriptional regulator [Dyella acidiphila]
MRAASARNLHGHVTQELGVRIVSGALRPGESLPREEVLAEQMAVSRTALREAMRVLSAKGLIEARPKVGTRVREERYWQQLDADVLAWRCASMPTADFVQKLVEMREIFEPAAAALAARRSNAEQFERIEAAYQAMEASRNTDEWAEADLEFHEAVLIATNNELMISLFSVVETALASYFVLSARKSSDFKYSLPYHRKVYEAIRKRQPDVARRAMLQMILDSRAHITGKRRSGKQA